jgi:hypothetical protein
MLAVVINVIVFFGILNYFIVIYTVATYSFRTAERSLWENRFFENSPKIKFSSDENDFWTRGFLDLRFITYIFWGFFRSREGPF